MSSTGTTPKLTQETPGGQAQRPRATSEEDAEIRRAKAMALAIQKNPSLSADEIQKLVGQSEQAQLIDQKKKKEGGGMSLLIPGRLASAFQLDSNATNTKDTSATLSSSSTKSNSGRVYENVISPSVPKKAPVSTSSTTVTTTPTVSITATVTATPKDAAASGPTTATDTPPVVSLSDASNQQPQQQQQQQPQKSKVPGSITSSTETSPSNRGTTKQQTRKNSVLQNIQSTFAKDDSPPKPREKARLSAVLWKRRSGLGKLSAKNAWERRRVVLRGNFVEYYLTEAELEEDNGSDDAENTNGNGQTGAEGAVPADLSSSGKKQNWFEQAMSTPFGNDDRNAARGTMDLLKEKASVAAASGHSGAPTPFAISIKAKGETKWKFCFDSHALQMQWLMALTDVVVSESVDHYNGQLLQAADPTHNESPMFFSQQATAMHPRNNVKSEADIGDGAGQENRLWMLEKYVVRSPLMEGETELEQMDDDEESVTDDDNSEEEEEGEHGTRDFVVEEPVVASDGISKAKTTTSVDWGFKGMDLYVAIAVVNMALVASSATNTSMESFWHIIAFANMTLWIILLKQQEKPKPAPSLDVGSPATASRAAIIRADGTKVVKASGKGRKFKKGKGTKGSETTGSSETKPFKPKAGSTTLRIEKPTDPAVKDGHTFAGWRAPGGENLLVRSHGYLSSKKKIPSNGTMYELVHCDIFEGPNRYPDMAKRVELPKVQFGDDGEASGPKTWTAPDIFVVCVSLPTDPPKLTKSSDDGGGYTIAMYFVMRQETRDILRRITAADYDPSKETVPDVQKSNVNAVRLFDEWCRRSPNDPKFMSRFKLIVNAQNLREIGVPGWIAKYNGKPVLIKRPGQTGFLYTHPELSCMEFDISLHPFPYLAKQGICYLKENFFEKVLAMFGFVIEGRADDELPECVIGVMQLCYPNPIHAIQAKEFFDGTGPKSFG